MTYCFIVVVFSQFLKKAETILFVDQVAELKSLTSPYAGNAELQVFCFSVESTRLP